MLLLIYTPSKKHVYDSFDFFYEIQDSYENIDEILKIQTTFFLKKIQCVINVNIKINSHLEGIENWIHDKVDKSYTC